MAVHLLRAHNGDMENGSAAKHWPGPPPMSNGNAARSRRLGLLAMVLLALAVGLLLRPFVMSSASHCALGDVIDAHDFCPIGAAKPIKCALDMAALLKPAPPGKSTVLRVPVATRNHYVENFNTSIDGWCGASSAYMATLISHYQHEHGLYGTVGEIGVHHGKFYVALAHTAAKEPVEETMFVCDVFSKQHLNLDSSGHGDREIFESNLQRHGVDPKKLTVYEGSSLDLSQELVGKLKPDLLPLRMLSVDGGHTFDIALSDVRQAACLIAPGGVVIVDDIFQQVLIQQAMHCIDKLNLCPNLKPFLVLDNKLWYTTASHQAEYIQFVVSTFRTIISEDADVDPAPQMLYAPQVAPPVFGSEVPIIAYVPGIKGIEQSPYLKLRERWLSLSSLSQ